MKKHESALFPTLPPTELDAMWTLLEESDARPTSNSSSSSVPSASGFPDACGAPLCPFDPSSGVLDGLLSDRAGSTSSIGSGSSSCPVLAPMPSGLDDELDMDMDLESDALSSSRHAQLEDNYERKKKRAKINRRDLHSRFQQLMQLLHLQEDRKLNRAKVLEHAIDHIQRLTRELDATRAQLSGAAVKLKSASTSSSASITTSRCGDGVHPAAASTSSSGAPGPMLPLGMPIPMSMRVNMNLNVPMSMPISMPMPMPMPMPPSGSTGPSSASSNFLMVPYAMSPAPIRLPCARPTHRANESLKRARPTKARTAALFCSIMQDLPCVLEFCDGWALAHLMATTRALGQAARRNELWLRLCQRRWHLQSTPILEDALAQWKKWHALQVMPVSASARGTTTTTFASGCTASIAVWVCLVRRATGRTTRSVLYAGSPVVRQVVELTLVVQNLHPVYQVKLTNQFAVASRDGTTAFEPISAQSGAHLKPTVVSKNDAACAVRRIDAVTLGHGEFCVLSVFVDCNGLDLEQEFLERIGGVGLSCEHWTHGVRQRGVWVQATVTEAARAACRAKPSIPDTTIEC